MRHPASEVRAAARRSYPASEVEAAGRSHLAPEARGGDPAEPPRARAQGRQLGEPPTPEARAGGREEQPEERWLHRHRRA